MKGPSSFEMSMRMGPGGMGGGGSDMSQTLFGLKLGGSDSIFMNLTGMEDDKMFHLTGFENIGGFLQGMENAVNGGPLSFLGAILAEIFDSADEVRNKENFWSMAGTSPIFDTEGSGGGGGDAAGSSNSGSNRAFGSLPAMSGMGMATDVPMAMLGNLHPSPTPGMGGMGMGMGMGGGMGG